MGQFWGLSYMVMSEFVSTTKHLQKWNMVICSDELLQELPGVLLAWTSLHPPKGFLGRSRSPCSCSVEPLDCSWPPAPELAQGASPGLRITVPHLSPPIRTNQANLQPWAGHERTPQVGQSTEIQTNAEGEALNSDSFHYPATSDE